MSNEPPMNLDDAKENLLLLKSVFDKHGLRFWLFAGTLLGAVREKAFIPYDFDIDICIYRADVDKYIETFPDLEKVGFSKYQNTQEYIRLLRRNFAIVRKDIRIDIFITRFGGNCWEFGEKVHHWYLRFPEECCTGFDTISFLGEDFLMPKHVEEFLVFMYGKDWKTPKKP